MQRDMLSGRLSNVLVSEMSESQSSRLTVAVKFHAYYSTTTGMPEAEVELPGRVSIRAALEIIWQLWPSLSSRPGPVMVLLNRARADGSDIVSDGDVLELLPPVAGG
jgi:molybdopterin converting factor small subunit